MQLSAVHVRFPVTNLGVSYRWYRRLLDRNCNERRRGAVAWKFYGGSIFEVIEDSAHAGCGHLTFLVPDLPTQLSFLHGQGLTVAASTTSDLIKLTVQDPDGNRVSFGQPIPQRYLPMLRQTQPPALPPR